jgi:hypothetical protein
MSTHTTHDEHTHTHGQGCNHTAVKHGDHVDYLHDGHLHRDHDGHVDECSISVSDQNPAACTTGHTCSSHAGDHKHAADCGHEAVPHGDHTDYLVDGHLHHHHSDHCDDHGKLEQA